jgi:hypothetical protein
MEMMARVRRAGTCATATVYGGLGAKLHLAVRRIDSVFGSERLNGASAQGVAQGVARSL